MFLDEQSMYSEEPRVLFEPVNAMVTACIQLRRSFHTVPYLLINSVNPFMLRTIDTTTFDEITVHSRTQTSRMSDINNFGVDVVRDFLRAVTGVPSNENFGNVITGKDSVQFSYEITFHNITSVCDYLLLRYQSVEYRNNFEWFDNLQYITDPILINHLNNSLIQSITTGNNAKLHLAPPEIIDWDDITGFSFIPNGQVFDDLKNEDFINILRERNIEVTVEKLKRRRIHVKDGIQQNIIAKWSIYNCIVFETEFDNDVYVLTVGLWFKVNRVFAEAVLSYLNTIDDCNLDLPNCQINEKEGDYNIRIGFEVDDVLTLDRQLVTYNGTSIEICDLLTRDKKFIHVKPWDSSSTLSHLFSQGRVSAESLIQDIEFRRFCRQRINGIDMSFGDVISEDAMNPREYEIVFAVIDSDQRPLTERLPFFSKLNMMQNIKFLRGLGFNVTKKKIIRTRV